ncbi:hypothetical protein KC865_03355 [Candidatus Kaiserbacteria bacterium]|nr:hypothetical protein [Candidatus Kaiserbacteria bacterium]USN92601.1 MAG: hypothetical protein H6782_02185 [Candidatus Nomurabacteria bacterium]
MTTLEKDLEVQVEQVLHSKSVGRVQKLLRSKSGVLMISIISFLESALPIPIITDPFLIAVILANRTKTALLVATTVVSSVVGGLFAFAVASLFFDTMVGYLSPEIMAEFQTMVSSNQSDTFMLTLVGAITPVPYTIVAWVVAVIEGGVITFILASVIGRGLRYFIVGYCTYRFGPLAISYAKRYIVLTSVIVLGLTVLYIWLKM